MKVDIRKKWLAFILDRLKGKASKEDRLKGNVNRLRS